jgi:hypothetical protein
MIWRHGDVLIASTQQVPANATRRPGAVLARGEFTGHSHRFAEPETIEVWEGRGMLFVTVLAERATVIHEEHKPITLPRGTYRVWQQREYTPEAIRRVMD